MLLKAAGRSGVSSASLQAKKSESWIMADNRFGTDQSGRGGADGEDPRSVLNEARAGAQHIGASMQRSARDFAEQQRDLAAEKVSEVAQAVQTAARDIEQQMPQASGFVHDAAEKLQDAASMLRERSVDDLMEGLNKFARQQPVIFFGGAVFAGFALSRFLKSSAEHRPGKQKA
jgi:hypothetical protein